MPRIVMFIPDEGDDVEVSVEGVKGPGCEEMTKELIEDLGQVVSSEKTEEFHERVRNQKTDHLHTRRS